MKSFSGHVKPSCHGSRGIISQIHVSGKKISQSRITWIPLNDPLKTFAQRRVLVKWNKTNCVSSIDSDSSSWEHHTSSEGQPIRDLQWKSWYMMITTVLSYCTCWSMLINYISYCFLYFCFVSSLAPLMISTCTIFGIFKE